MASNSECDDNLLPEIHEDSSNNANSGGDCDVVADLAKPKDDDASENPTVSEVREENSQDLTCTESLNLLDENTLKEMAKLRFQLPDLSEPNRSERQDGDQDEERTGSTPSPDSGGNEDKDIQEEEKDLVLPTEEVMEKIVKQVESYFTDFNIMKDKFLLKHIRRNKEGYISLKLVASFRRVKTLTKDWRVVRHSLQQSKQLQLNAEGTKIKRVQPVPDFQDTTCAKTVLVFNLPLESPTPDDVTKMMTKYGDVAEVTVVTPGSSVPDVCTKRCLSYYNDLASKTFALVEFKMYNSAVAAMKAHETLAEDEMKVVPLLSDVYKNKAKSVSPKKSSKSPKSDSAQSDPGDRKSNSGKKRSARHRSRVEEIKGSDSSTSSSDSLTGHLFSPNSRNQQHEKDPKAASLTKNLPKVASQSASPVNKSDSLPKLHHSKSNPSIRNDMTSNYSWMPRRFNSRNNVHHLSPSNNQRLPENVVRLPKGPDGTDGFHSRRVNHSEVPLVATTDITDVIKNFIATH